MMKEKIAIIGAGSWGSALARIVSDNGYDVILFDVDQDIVNEINQFHTNKSKLPVGKLSEKVSATTDLKEAISFGDIIVLAVPTAVVRKVLADINNIITNPKIFVNASKGIEPDTYKRVSEITYEEIRHDFITGFVALTGPSHAEEVILQMLTVIAAASDDLEIAQKIQRIFSNQTYFRVYSLNDLIGAELGGSLKNIIALASGIAEGLGYGDNTKAALITRGLVEMRRLATAMGAKDETLFGLTGLGDLVVTATSKHSRNFQAGYKIGSGSDLKKTLSEMTMVVEGARSCISAYQVSKTLGVDTPIIDAVYDIIYNQVDPRERIMELMKRSLKEE